MEILLMIMIMYMEEVLLILQILEEIEFMKRKIYIFGDILLMLMDFLADYFLIE
jgi:hypothetical protein